MSYNNRRTPRHRPATIQELADQAKTDLGDPPTQGLKNWLRYAEKARKSGQIYKDRGDYEAAFVDFAKAATIVLDHLPHHPEYTTLLNLEQRRNLGNNGQDILHQLGECKVVLVERYEDWVKGAGSSRSSSSEQSSEAREDALRRKKEQERRALEDERAQQAIEATRQEQEWQRNTLTRRQAEEASYYARQTPSDNRRRDDQRAQEARELAEHERIARIHREEESRRQEAEDEALKRRISDRREQEQAGILRRQQEADAAARAARRDHNYGRNTAPPVVHADANVPVHAPQPSRPGSSQDVIFAPSSSYLEPGAPQAMPLESPNRLDYDSSTDAEGTEPKAPWQRGRHESANNTPTRAKHGGIVYPVPLTTTSPAPPELGQVEYPRLMSQHQLKQGYVPSLQSMFSHMSMDAPTSSSALLFEAKPDSYPGLPHHPAQSISYPGMPIPSSIPHPHPLPHPPPPLSHPHSHSPHVGHRGPSPSGARPPPPPIPPKQPIQPAVPNTPRIIKGNVKDPNVRELKSVRLPRECLPKFLSIARINTLQNRETCGLLLGKDKGDKYVVTTLLVPKQHSTSDTCTMDEEELVMQFTEERHLITLGWIHTHPTQSCFMSSVDLHTHSGFQCMLPESFAVVCAPSSTPTFGLFRLTDPGGLQTILSCNAKEAFHPHPEVPIYTDCDNSHVQMKDISLEIVDLR
ncbi:hypothetical protein QCA50_018285 [Cerrena zonata]|uniref:MPN domain-containing protein n=1 Tax=Cerrena zonata TaxID=2478898 RepID=A0AAW0FD10_9APHY